MTSRARKLKAKLGDADLERGTSPQNGVKGAFYILSCWKEILANFNANRVCSVEKRKPASALLESTDSLSDRKYLETEPRWKLRVSPQQMGSRTSYKLELSRPAGRTKRATASCDSAIVWTLSFVCERPRMCLLNVENGVGFTYPACLFHKMFPEHSVMHRRTLVEQANYHRNTTHSF